MNLTSGVYAGPLGITRAEGGATLKTSLSRIDGLSGSISVEGVLVCSPKPPSLEYSLAGAIGAAAIHGDAVCGIDRDGVQQGGSQDVPSVHGAPLAGGRITFATFTILSAAQGATLILNLVTDTNVHAEYRGLDPTLSDIWKGHFHAVLGTTGQPPITIDGSVQCGY